MKEFIINGIFATTEVAVAAPYDVSAGGGLLASYIFGIAAYGVASGEMVDIATEGVFAITKTASETFSAGDIVYWNNSTKAATSTAGTNKKIGIAAEAAAANDATVTTDIDGAFASEPTSNLTSGYTATAYNAGTKTTGTFTPDPALGNMQRAVNGGAHTLAPPSVGSGDSTTMDILYTNNASAGALTTSGFTKVGGDALTTTNGHKFMMHIVVINAVSELTVVAMQ